MPRIINGSFDQELADIVARLERHAKTVDQTAIATELLKAAEYREENERNRLKERKIQCQRWLNPTNVREVHQRQLQARLEGTCTWIHSNPIFTQWKSGRNLTDSARMLCISGIHGCGKSLLASFIVQGIESEGLTHLFFAFSSVSGTPQTTIMMLRTLLWQLLEKNSNEEHINKIYGLLNHPNPALSDLWEVLCGILASGSEPMYCIIDGIDECLDFDRIIWERMYAVLPIIPNLRVLLLGRPHVIQAEHLIDLNNGRILEITPTTIGHDIEAFIEAEVDKSEILKLPGLSVAAALKEKSGGMFLWVKLMIEDLKRASTKYEAIVRQNSLPHGLEEAYEHVFYQLSQRLDQFEWRLVQNILAFTVVSCRPMHYEELRSAHAFSCKLLADEDVPLADFLLTLSAERVQDLCGGLLSVENGIFRLVHSSVREFLTRPKHSLTYGTDGNTEIFRIDIIETHRLFASLCLDCISLGSSIDHSSFLNYAVLHVFHHLNQSWPPSPALLGSATGLLLSTRGIYWAERVAYILLTDLSIDAQRQGMEMLTVRDRLSSLGIEKDLLADLARTWAKAWNKELDSQTKKLGGNGLHLTQQHFLLFLMNGLINGREGSSGNEERNEHEENEAREKIEERPEGNKENLKNEMNEEHNEQCSARTIENQIYDVPRSSSTLEDPKKPFSPPISSRDLSDETSQILRLLTNHEALPTRVQLEVLLALQFSLRKIRVVTDPLKILFRLLMRKASVLPVHALLMVAEFYDRVGKPGEGLEVYAVALKKVEHLHVPVKYYILHEMGDIYYYRLRKYEEALDCFCRAVSGRTQLYGKMSGKTLSSMYGLGKSYSSLNQWKNALITYHILLDGKESVAALSDEDNAWLLGRMGIAYSQFGEYRTAIKYLKRLLHLWEAKLVGDNAIRSGKTELGFTYERLEKYDRALKWHREAYFAHEKFDGPEHLLTLDSQRSIGSCYRLLGQYDEAQEWLQKAYEGQQKVFGDDHEDTIWTNEELDLLQADIVHDQDMATQYSPRSSRASNIDDDEAIQYSPRSSRSSVVDDGDRATQHSARSSRSSSIDSSIPPFRAEDLGDPVHDPIAWYD